MPINLTQYQYLFLALKLLVMASNIFLKRKTHKVPFMFPRKKVVRPVPIMDFVTLGGDCVSCIFEPICILF